MLQTLLEFDKNLLISARSCMHDDWTFWIVIFGELIVVWYAIFIVWLWLYGTFKKSTPAKKAALNIGVLICLVFGIYSILNFGIPQWRESPQDIVWSVKALIPHPIDNSFPSGHALFWGAGLVGICMFWKKNTLLFLSLWIGLISNLARIFWAVHYPWDTIFGFIIGILWAFLLLPLGQKITDSIFPFVQKIASFFRL